MLSDPRMRLVEVNNAYGGHAIFACTFGYTVDPRPGLMCESTGQWDRPLPRCKRQSPSFSFLPQFMSRVFEFSSWSAKCVDG